MGGTNGRESTNGGEGEMGKTTTIAEVEGCLMRLAEEKFTGSLELTFRNGKVLEDAVKRTTRRLGNGE